MPSASSQEGGESRVGEHSTTKSRISAVPATTSAGSTETAHGVADIERTIEVLRDRIDEEFRISERLDSKARQLFALAAGFFAAVQAVAFGAFGNGGLTKADRLILLVFTLAAGTVLLLVGHRLANAEEPLKECDIRPDELVEWLESGDSEEQVLLRQVGALAEVAKSRAANNARRKDRYDELQPIARWSLIASSVELLAAIVVRL
jgi:hypothetical protein